MSVTAGFGAFCFSCASAGRATIKAEIRSSVMAVRNECISVLPFRSLGPRIASLNERSWRRILHHRAMFFSGDCSAERFAAQVKRRELRESEVTLVPNQCLARGNAGLES